MTRFTNLLSVFLILTLLPACEKEKDDTQLLKEEVINVHDEVMPKMDNIMKLKAELKAIKQDTANVIPSDKLIQLNNLILNLEKADREMMEWMRNYDPLMEGMTEEEQIVYLKAQKISIKRVKQSMLSAILDAELYTKKN